MEQPNRKGVQRVRHELRIRDVAVSRVDPLGDSFLAISFQGEALEGFVSASFDDHVKFMFEIEGKQLRRDYTPLWYDADKRELTLEFALHEGGGASDWAKSAAVGQQAVIGGPRGSMIIPMEYDWYLLAGDRSALPAIRRRLAELPLGSRAIVVAAASGADRLPLPTQAQLDLTWVEDDQGLLAALRDLTLPLGEGFAWFAGEAATAKQVRSLLGDGKGIAKEAMRVSAYWKQGVADHHENLE
ncbi:siderophore-interacting protein [Massilia sp. IC2-477]|uniref:siderophore-interacting protein n=1 Tax=Massilia sp. IC2-477 TaxID=2887198 RepID=UPI001D0F69B5|nr:siderophore-interacting protein [Massilia sp. IC2-477]MCC2955593.1 siderophore-interacting protein [Massilia sp. IC2-477]